MHKVHVLQYSNTKLGTKLLSTRFNIYAYIIRIFKNTLYEEIKPKVIAKKTVKIRHMHKS